MLIEIDKLKKWFDIALTKEGADYQSFAASMEPPVTRQYISQVLSKNLKASPRVIQAIYSYCQKVLPAVHRDLSTMKDMRHPLFINNVS